MGRLIRFILDMDARAWRTVVVTFLLFGGAGLIFLIAIPALGWGGQATVSHWLGVAAKSPFALLIAVGAFAVLAFAGVPQVVLIAAAVVAFGPELGFAYSWIGTMVSAAVGFWLGRVTGGRLLRQVGGEKLKTFMAMIGKNGFLASLIVRLVPSAPFVVINMAAGMTPMRFWAFAAGAAIGIAPKILLTAMAGHSVAHARSGQLWANLGLFALALLIWIGAGLWARRWIRRHERETEQSSPGSP
ncbi:MAG TPA: VTT domain-containing protein [Caulobacteraceae bacterium]|nr:VTT domain-containing protein [Caulobacteraceae bacterium]